MSDSKVTAALCFAIGVCALAFPSHAEGLSSEQRTYLASLGKVKLCVDPDWVPFERINDHGEHEGIAADLLRLAASRAGFELELLKTGSWKESLESSQSGKCHILSFLNQTAKRDEWLIFTEPLFTDSNVLITREEHEFIADPATLSGETIVLPRGTSMMEFVKRDYPNLTILPTDSESERDMMIMVSERKAHMTLRSLIVAAYTIKKEGLFNLKIAGQIPKYENKLRVGVVKSEPMLRDIIDQGIATITPTERGQIVNRHVSINVQTATDYTAVIQVSAVLGFVAAISLFWNHRLRLVNAKLADLSQTDPLTRLFNRRKMDIEFGREIDRANRYGRPLSAMIIDIDHFKKVNDELGHPTGDVVIRSVADIIKDRVRDSDIVGRWGGEEYLVLCPETTKDDAMALGGRLVHAVESHDFATGRSHTISVGVATAILGGEETPHTLLSRAD
ncbi:MAG: diguanylate cyclase, partial [Alphaproteobacteria bacterium]|nr:diguanylate cyclase [Alphaproteobacteria bacterium]